MILEGHIIRMGNRAITYFLFSFIRTYGIVIFSTQEQFKNLAPFRLIYLGVCIPVKLQDRDHREGKYASIFLIGHLTPRIKLVYKTCKTCPAASIIR